MKLAVYYIIWFPLCLILILLSTSLLLIYKPKDILTKKNTNEISKISYTSVNQNIPQIDISPRNDIRILALNLFLKKYNSPLIDYSEDLIRQADLWGIDYSLIPAIAMQESGGCKYIPPESYNCWGFGIYGSKVTKFPSYKDAIMKIAQVIKEAYIKEGLTNPTLLEDRWAPQSRGQWSYSVTLYMSKIHSFESNIPVI